MIHEVIVTTINENERVHIAPMGIKFVDHADKKCVQISPFKPSQTLDNLLKTEKATVNFIDDVKVFAGIVTGREKDWDLSPCSKNEVAHLSNTNSYMNLKVSSFIEDELRPKIICNILNTENLRPFMGFNRAQFSVIELAVLSTRLGMIDDEKVKKEYDYLKIGIDKTGGEREKLAWSWIEEKIEGVSAEAGRLGEELGARLLTKANSVSLTIKP